MKRTKGLLKRCLVVLAIVTPIAIVERSFNRHQVSTTTSTSSLFASPTSTSRRLTHHHHHDKAPKITGGDDDNTPQYNINTNPDGTISPGDTTKRKHDHRFKPADSFKHDAHSTYSSLLFTVLSLSFSAFFVFLGLALVCDDYLSPALSVLCAHYRLPHDVAGATLVSLGSAAPALCMNAQATAQGDVALSLPAIFGSAILAFGAIPALCVLAGGRGEGLIFATWPVVRDSLAYVVSLLLALYFLRDGSVSAYESGCLTALYALYLQKPGSFPGKGRTGRTHARRWRTRDGGPTRLD